MQPARAAAHELRKAQSDYLLCLETGARHVERQA
jgi:hypothetical protein